MGYTLCTKAKQAMQQLFTKQPRVTFADKAQQRVFHTQDNPIMVTYDSGADGHYIIKSD